jgi:hypothetical protein
VVNVQFRGLAQLPRRFRLRRKALFTAFFFASYDMEMMTIEIVLCDNAQKRGE